MEISTLQIIAIYFFPCIRESASVLDEFQTHRPLIACTVIGLILGDLKTGVMLGGTLELIALGWMNVGAAQSPDSALASIISAILVIVGHQSIATGIAIALPVAAAGQVLTVFARTITVVFQHAADKAAEARFRTIDLLHVSALWVQALRVAIPALVVSLFVSADMAAQYAQRDPGIRHPRPADCRWFHCRRGLRDGAANDGREIPDALLFPRFSRRGLSRLQPAGLRRRGRHHRADLHPAQSTVA